MKSFLTLACLFVSALAQYPINVKEECIGVQYGVHHGVYDQTCVTLQRLCAKDSSNPNLWASKTCIAAATCNPVKSLMSITRCSHQVKSKGTTVPPRANQNNLDYNIYASIVGNCAWAQGGCPITQQNYVDFFYSVLSSTQASVWPTYETVVRNWNDITSWTATGNTVPYTNFNDWLHYAENTF